MKYYDKEYCREYYQKNKIAILKKHQAYKEKNKDKIKAYNQKYRKENKEKIKEQEKQYKRKKKGKIKLYLKKYYKRNKHIIKKREQKYNQEHKEERQRYHSKYDKKYKSEHPEECKINNHKRRARVKGNGDSYTMEEITQLRKETKGICKGWKRKPHYVGDENLEVEHIIAIANGGTNEIENIQLMCQNCNRRKGKKIQEQDVTTL